MRNQAGVQLLTRSLHEQIFKNHPFGSATQGALSISQTHLKAHGLSGQANTEQPETPFTLPPLLGKTIDEHFWSMGMLDAKPYLDLANDFAAVELPPQPENWARSSGWTRYNADGTFDAVDNLPEGEAVCFDVETMYKLTNYPCMATAATATAWYAWISPWLLDESESMNHLIPIAGSVKPRIVVGHNVGYDRARIAEEYHLTRTKSRFLDTMSLHAAVNGLSSPQRPAWMVYKKNKAAKLARQASADDEEEVSDAATAWQDNSSMNSLAEVAKFHCDIDVDKTIRNAFSTEDKQEISGEVELHDLLTYCANDVKVTHQVFKKVFPAYLKACPSPVSLSGILHMSVPFLPVDESWDKFVQAAESKYQEMKDAVLSQLHALAEEARHLVLREDEHGRPLYESDPWLKQLDWTPKTARRSITPAEGSAVLQRNPEAASVENEEPAIEEPADEEVIQSDPNAESQGEDTSPVSMHLAKTQELCKPTWKGFPARYDSKAGWYFEVPVEKTYQRDPKTEIPLEGGDKKRLCIMNRQNRVKTLLGPTMHKHIESGTLKMPGLELKDKTLHLHGFPLTSTSERAYKVWNKHLTGQLLGASKPASQPQKATARKKAPPETATITARIAQRPRTVPFNDDVWPKWFWDLDRRPSQGDTPGLELTTRTKIAPLLLKISWYGKPIFHSKEHGWTFQVPKGDDLTKYGLMSNTPGLHFKLATDTHLHDDPEHRYYRLPHHSGGDANVGSPLSKNFVKASEDGRLSSAYEATQVALDLNAQCSYWVSSRDRIINQYVVYQDEQHKMGLPSDQKTSDEPKKVGLILPQVVTMGTVTRRAVEKTWLTASNAKKNRVGSELKSLVRAPPGYAIVGADVDSEELWICSVMGDAYFGMHGATAIGWMTLEGSKSAGTDMHSSTAKILGISRDEAKVFNYSRIYGAGVKHAVELLRKSNPSLTVEKATSLAKDLYAKTKGTKIRTTAESKNPFQLKFWYGGSESYVFNKLESIAMSEKPATPALGCGITQALMKNNLQAEGLSGAGEGYLPSRINWVVQSSGVDYLHMLIASMEYLMQRYEIAGRYMISVHDEIRYLVKDEDKNRLALALQIANLWTRSMFAYSLHMSDLPQVSFVLDVYQGFA